MVPIIFKEVANGFKDSLYKDIDTYFVFNWICSRNDLEWSIDDLS